MVDYGEYLDREVGDNIEAVVIVCDYNIDNIEEVENIWGMLKESSPSVCLLISEKSDKVNVNEIAKDDREYFSWCLRNEFEFVDLNDDGDIEDNECDYDDKFGKERILEALLAHTWSNLVLLNEDSEVRKNFVLRVENEEEDSDEYGDFVTCQEAKLEEDCDFESLFAKLSTMKDKASDLPDLDRKNYAENVAIAFFKAMGGSEEDF